METCDPTNKRPGRGRNCAAATVQVFWDLIWFVTTRNLQSQLENVDGVQISVETLFLNKYIVSII